MTTGSRSVRGKLILAGILVLAGAIEMVAAAQDATAETRLDLGDDKTNPGGEAFLPVILSAAPGLEIGTLQTEITFPNKLASFQGANKAIDSADVEFTTTVKSDPKNPDVSVLEVKVAKTTGKAILSGVVLNLILKISEQAQVGQKIELENRPTAQSTDNPPRTVQMVGGNGEIEVIKAPEIFACFFYMH